MEEEPEVSEPKLYECSRCGSGDSFIEKPSRSYSAYKQYVEVTCENCGQSVTREYTLTAIY